MHSELDQIEDDSYLGFSGWLAEKIRGLKDKIKGALAEKLLNPNLKKQYVAADNGLNNVITSIFSEVEESRQLLFEKIESTPEYAKAGLDSAGQLTQ
jgi:hypothetical protein